MELDLQARQLNDRILAGSPAVVEMLSTRGKAIFFPKLGILSQSAEAQGREINATIGIALEEDGTPMRLPCIAQRVPLPPDKAFSYAPSPGRPDMRKAWKDVLTKKNPSLAGKSISLPVVTCALTHGLSMSGYLFCEPGDRVVFPDLYWENYELIFGQAYGAVLDPFPMFAAGLPPRSPGRLVRQSPDPNRDDGGNASAFAARQSAATARRRPAEPGSAMAKRGGGFNVEGFRAKLGEEATRKTLVILNFPNNPTGYTPTCAEVEDIVAVLREAAQRGTRLVVMVDDAYFGLVYEPGIFAESIFGLLCDLHSNLLAIKLDGPTKEDYVWGFRVGFMTYGIQGGTPPVYEALEAKTAGAIRGNISNVSNMGQSLLVSAFAAPGYDAEKRQKYELLRRRYEKVKQVLAAHPEYRSEFEPIPFNSGYFMCLRMFKADPERLRQKLLTEYSTGVIVMSGLIRLAFSATPLNKIEKLFDNVFRASQALSAS